MTKPPLSLDREKRIAYVKNKILTWDDPSWHVFVDKDDEVYVYHIQDQGSKRPQYQIFRGIWSKSSSLGEYLVPVDVTGYVVPKEYQLSGSAVGSFLRTGLTITTKLPLLKSVMSYKGEAVCVEDLILGGEKPIALISHNNVALPYIEEVDVNLLELHIEKNQGYNPCTSFEALEEPETRRAAYYEIKESLNYKTPQAKFCSCSMQTLLRSGCKCGGS